MFSIFAKKKTKNDFMFNHEFSQLGYQFASAIHSYESEALHFIGRPGSEQIDSKSLAEYVNSIDTVVKEAELAFNSKNIIEREFEGIHGRAADSFRKIQYALTSHNRRITEYQTNQLIKEAANVQFNDFMSQAEK